MTVQFYVAGADVTILVSKKSGRYRLQSAAFEALAIITEELADRLTNYYAKVCKHRAKARCHMHVII